MSFYDFSCDYNVGAHPQILKRLSETNSQKSATYGLDEYSESAKAKIRHAIGDDAARIYFLVGGTQANATVLSSILAPYEGVVSAVTGHIACHESGAVEAGGHKVMTVPHHNGKIDARELENVFLSYENDATREHTVKPGAVYISHPTEYGTLYTKSELEGISRVCKKHGARLFLDGARLGYGLMAPGTDVTLSDIAALTDVFYIGGTKVGALFGEAVVITNPDICPMFFTMIKQNGALLAKGRMLGIQFDTLFTDGLYFKISENAISNAMYMKKELAARGYEFYIDSPTNQQFVIVDDEKLESIREHIGYSFWERSPDGRSVIRLVTSFATSREEVDEALKYF